LPRPKKDRFVQGEPPAEYFKPRGIPLSELEEVRLTVEELEALRLADLEGLYQEEVSVRMGVSRQTIQRMLNSARKKVATALTCGNALRIEGGNYMVKPGGMPPRGRGAGRGQPQ
jgi:predicted DNA-binding protein (UPF0251 family)